jgi:hypothetical protein
MAGARLSNSINDKLHRHSPFPFQSPSFLTVNLITSITSSIRLPQLLNDCPLFLHSFRPTELSHFKNSRAVLESAIKRNDTKSIGNDMPQRLKVSGSLLTKLREIYIQYWGQRLESAIASLPNSLTGSASDPPVRGGDSGADTAKAHRIEPDILLEPRFIESHHGAFEGPKLLFLRAEYIRIYRHPEMIHDNYMTGRDSEHPPVAVITGQPGIGMYYDSRTTLNYLKIL